MSDVSYLLEAIPSVCGPKTSRINKANSLVAEKSNDIADLVIDLNNLCGGSFISKANTANVVPPAAVADSISTALTSAGQTPSDDIALKKKVGSADVSGITTATGGEVDDTLSATIVASDAKFGDMTTLNVAPGDQVTMVAALNNVAASSYGAYIYTPVGTLGSFYEYGDFDSDGDSEYLLIASGSTDLSSHIQAMQKYANWAQGKFTLNIAAGNVYSSPISSYSFSLSDSGEIFTINDVVVSINSAETLCRWALDH